MDNNPIFIKEYPYNLIQSVRNNTQLAFPVASEKKVCTGLEFVLSKLSDPDQNYIKMRFVEQKSIEQISEVMAVTAEELRLQEQSILRKLRESNRWNYIYYGIEGYIRIRMEEVKRIAYQRGYTDGYQKGLQDGPSGDVGKNLPEHILNMPIEVMGLPKHAYNCLFYRQCERVRDVIALNEDEIFRIRNMGKVTARVIAEKLHEFGIYNTAWDIYLI